MHEHTSTAKAMPGFLLGVLLAITCFGCQTAKAPVGPGGVSASTTVATTSIPPLNAVKFVFSPLTPETGQSVNFNASASSAGAGQRITSYVWDFGDGATGGGVTVAHAYAVAGTYNVNLTLIDDAAQRMSDHAAVSVVAAPSSTTAALQFVNATAVADSPNDITIVLQAKDSNRFSVRGTFSTPNGVAGTVTGTFTGTLLPVLSGDFAGSLFSDVGRCTAEATFSGPTGQNLLTWRRVAVINDCGGASALLAPTFSSFTLLQSTQPPKATTTTSTTSIPNTSTTVASTSTVPAGFLTGTVLVSGTNNPVKNASVTVVPLSGGVSLTLTTNNAGAFTAPLSPGAYVVKVNPLPNNFTSSDPPDIQVNIANNSTVGTTVAFLLK